MDTLEQLFRKVIINNWDSFALTDYPGESITYGVFYSRILELQKQWNNLDVHKDDKIAICATNSSIWIIVFMAAILRGNTIVIIPPNLPNSDATNILKHCLPRILYADISLFEDISINYSSLNIMPFEIESIFSQQSMEQFQDSTQIKGISSANKDSKKTCAIIYSSGTTGTPKGIMFSEDAIYSGIIAGCAWASKYENKNSRVNILPFFHIFGLTADALVTIFSGGHLIVVKEKILLPRLHSLMEKYNPTLFLTIPLLVSSIIDTIVPNLEIGPSCNVKKGQIKAKLLAFFGKNLTMLIYGGSNLPEEYENIIQELRLPFCSGYGLSEIFGPVSIESPQNKVYKSCGKILDPLTLRIDAINIISGLDGEIQIKDKRVFIGYYLNDDETNAVFSEDGWFKTGDLGYIDDDGNLFITGRCKDMLLTSNGENIYPEVIEEAMNASPYIKESILIQRGEKIQAIIVPDWEKAKADGLVAEALDKKIDEAVREASKKLPGFTIIGSYELRDEPLERTPKGSLKRFLYSEGIKEN